MNRYEYECCMEEAIELASQQTRDDCRRLGIREWYNDCIMQCRTERAQEIFDINYDKFMAGATIDE